MGMEAMTRKPPLGRGPEMTVPPKAAARSAMPTRPCPFPSKGAAAPRPSSSTWRISAASVVWSSIVISAWGPACLSELVRASWQMR